MAGDWIKMRCNLWDDPRVSNLCDITGSGEASVIGGLYRLWVIADQHSEHGVLPGMNVKSIDRKTGVKRLGEALVEIGWLVDTPEGIQIVRFDEHNGESAKVRAQTARRVAKHKGNAQVTQEALPIDDSANADTVSQALPREDNREDIKQKPRAERFDAQARLESFGVPSDLAKDWLAVRKVKKLAPTATAFEDTKAEADKAGISMTDAVRMCCVRGWGGFKASWLNEQQPVGRINGHTPNAFE